LFKGEKRRVEGGELPHLAGYPEGEGFGTAIL